MLFFRVPLKAFVDPEHMIIKSLHHKVLVFIVMPMGHVSGLPQACTTNEKSTEEMLPLVYKHHSNTRKTQNNFLKDMFKCMPELLEKNPEAQWNYSMPTRCSTLVQSPQGLTVHVDLKALWYIFVEQPCTEETVNPLRFDRLTVKYM